MVAPGTLEWLAREEDAINTLINWVVLDLKDADGGEAWLTSAADLSPVEVDSAVEAGIRAIIAVGETTYPARFKDAGLPVVCLPGEDAHQATYRKLLTVLINQRAYLMERGNEIHARLTHLAAEGAGLDGIASAMSEISGRGVMIQDKRMDLIAVSTPMALNGVWDEVTAFSEARAGLPEILRDRKTAGQQRELQYQEINGDLARLVTSVNVGGVARGYLSVVGKNGELNALSRVVAEQGAVVSAVEMSRSKAVRETEKRLRGDLLTALLRGELSPQDARLWTQRMGLNLDERHACLRFAWDGPNQPSLRRLETVVNNEVGHAGYPAIVSPLDEEVICFVEVTSGAARPDNVVSLGRSVLDRAQLQYPESGPRGGIGTPAELLEDWRNSFRQSGQALQMARRLTESRPLYFPDLSVYRLLLQIEHNAEVQTFHEEILGPLVAYDNGVELIRTLEAYFERNGNVKKTANALYIHRNTLIYRLERIQEITGLDLSNPDTRLALQLTLHIHRMLDERAPNKD
jgi:purine catabolism regulator